MDLVQIIKIKRTEIKYKIEKDELMIDVKKKTEK